VSNLLQFFIFNFVLNYSVLISVDTLCAEVHLDIIFVSFYTSQYYTFD